MIQPSTLRGRLNFWRCAINFIYEHDVRKNWALDENETIRLGIENTTPVIRGQKVGDQLTELSDFVQWLVAQNRFAQGFEVKVVLPDPG